MCFNIFGMYTTRSQKDELVRMFKVIKPPMCVVIDDLAFAGELKAASPGTEVITRDFRYDFDNAHRQLSPEQWMIAHQAAGEAGFTLYANNEPAWNVELINWLHDIAKRCIAKRWKVVLGNFSVGTPGEMAWGIGKDLLTTIGNNRQYLRLGLHEYAPTLWTYEFGRETDATRWVGVGGLPYLVGRYRWVLKYCHDNSIPAPLIAFTEWGFDTIHAAIEWQKTVPGFKEPMGIINSRPAFGAWGGGKADHYAFLSLKAMWERLYRQDSANILGMALFCYGHEGGSLWQYFDWSKTIVPQYILADGGFKKGEIPVSYTIVSQGTIVKQQIINNISTILNQRSIPSTDGIDKGDVHNGDTINLVIDSHALSGVYTWRRIIVDGESRWIAVKGGGINALFSDLPEPEIPPATRAEIRASLAGMVTELNRLIAQIDEL